MYSTTSNILSLTFQHINKNEPQKVFHKRSDGRERTGNLKKEIRCLDPKLIEYIETAFYSTFL